MQDPSTLESIPVTYQELQDFFARQGPFNPFSLRKETFKRIEQVTKRPLICYVTKTNAPVGIPAYIDDTDLVGFSDLVRTTEGKIVDVLIISNGGVPEASERIVRLLRGRFNDIRFLIPANAYSAATLISFSGDQIVMDEAATLGPIDPQINGVPARAILRAFDTLEKRLKEEGPGALAAYIPLINKYDLHILEICKSAQELSDELARTWLSEYMFHCMPTDPRVNKIVDFFKSYDIHKSHGRSIDREVAFKLGLTVIKTEEIRGLADLLLSLRNQYTFWFEQTPFFKLFESARGINWGRQVQEVRMQIPPFLVPGAPPPSAPAPEPGPPKDSTSK